MYPIKHQKKYLVKKNFRRSNMKLENCKELKTTICEINKTKF